EEEQQSQQHAVDGVQDRQQQSVRQQPLPVVPSRKPDRQVRSRLALLPHHLQAVAARQRKNEQVGEAANMRNLGNNGGDKPGDSSDQDRLEPPRLVERHAQSAPDLDAHDENPPQNPVTAGLHMFAKCSRPYPLPDTSGQRLLKGCANRSRSYSSSLTWQS